MANTIGFGQAAVNNTIDYGQGAIDNTINWGKSQTLSPSGETNITGTGGTPPFTNTKSILLDGIDDYVDCGSISSINSASIVSISMWVKKSSSNNVDASVGSLVNNTNGIWLNWYTDNTLYFTVRNGAFMTTSYALSGDTNWHNIVGVYNGVNSKIYVDGSLVATGSNVPSSLSPSAGSNFQIGALNGGSLTSGNIDEVSIFNTELSQSDVTTIWNNGVPSDISSINGITNWWRCGDGDTAPILTDNIGSNNGTMVFFNTFSTDVPTASSFTNTKSILLDGIDDYVTFGNMSSFSGATQFTFSGWYKFNSVPERESIFSILVDNNNFFDVLMYGSLTYIQLKVGGTAQFVQFNSSFFTSNQWAHLVVAYDNTQSTNREKLKVYIDNVDIYYNISTAITLALPTGTNTVTIGETSRLSGVFLNGNADECAVFNTQLSASDVTSIYNGGVPNDISSLSPLSWWRCGDGDTAPTLTDNGSGGNNGTMVFFNTFSTDVPT